MRAARGFSYFREIKLYEKEEGHDQRSYWQGGVEGRFDRTRNGGGDEGDYDETGFK
jgi:hypothetical protein